MCFHIIRIAKTAAHKRLIFKVQKPVEAKSFPFLSKYFNAFSWYSPYNTIVFEDSLHSLEKLQSKNFLFSSKFTAETLGS
jgi:hypothetical protein